jgi:hypothetical protein
VLQNQRFPDDLFSPFPRPTFLFTSLPVIYMKFKPLFSFMTY